MFVHFHPVFYFCECEYLCTCSLHVCDNNAYAVLFLAFFKLTLYHIYFIMSLNEHSII